MLGSFNCTAYRSHDTKNLYRTLNLFSEKGSICLLCRYYSAFEKINQLHLESQHHGCAPL